MADPRDYSRYQQGVIRRFYENRGAIREQALSDLVSDLWLATTPKKKDALWKRAEALLQGLGVAPSEIAAVLSTRDVRALAEVANRAFRSSPKDDWKADDRESRRG